MRKLQLQILFMFSNIVDEFVEYNVPTFIAIRLLQKFLFNNNAILNEIKSE